MSNVLKIRPNRSVPQLWTDDISSLVSLIKLRSHWTNHKSLKLMIELTSNRWPIAFLVWFPQLNRLTIGSTTNYLNRWPYQSIQPLTDGISSLVSLIELPSHWTDHKTDNRTHDPEELDGSFYHSAPPSTCNGFFL